MPLIARLVRWSAALFVFVVAAALALLWWAKSGRGDESLEAHFPTERLPDAVSPPPFASGGALRVMTYNIAYGRGDGSDSGGPWSREHIERNLDAIAAVVRESGAEVLAVQEVDFAAARSHGIDQAAYLARATGLGHYACAVTWQLNYVPFPYWPPSRHYGRMKSGQCVLSRYPIVENTRFRLPQPAAKPFWYNWFYLHRAVQHVVVQLAPDLPLDVFNVHLEAFDAENRREHANRLLNLVAHRARTHAVILGDFNALPPQAGTQHGFVDEPDIDFRGDDTMAKVAVAGWTEALGALTDRVSVFTFPVSAPTRRLDYVFGRGVSLEQGRVFTEAGAASDHLPIAATAMVKR
jgi:endonuclease/exonuclease/phosphatase family metal-dependent hydrolase